MLNKLGVFFLSLALTFGCFIPNAESTVITGIPTLTVGGRVFTDLTNLIILCASADTNSNATFRKCDAGSSGYTPSGSKKFVAMAIDGYYDNTTSYGDFALGYADSDVGYDSASAFTNPVYLGGSSKMYAGVSNSGGTGARFFAAGINFTVPNGKYLIASQAHLKLFVYGYEQ